MSRVWVPTDAQAIDKALKAAGVYKAINQEQAKQGKVDFVKVRRTLSV